MYARSVTAEPAPFVSIVVPVRNGEAVLADCVRSLLALDYPAERREIIVVDNSSTDSTASVATSFPVTYLLEERVGRAYARNRGVEESRGELVALLDADCIASPEWLRHLASGFEDNGVDGVAGEIVPYAPTTPAERYMARKQPRWQLPAHTHERPFAVTANVAYRMSVFEQIGLFDPLFVTSEDVDLSYRFFNAGLRLAYAEKALAYHRDRASARELFRQQYGLGYGRALARTVYRIPVLEWEIKGYRDLAVGLGRLALAPVASLAGKAGEKDSSFAYHDVVLLSALRLGALRYYATSWHGRERDAPPQLSARAPQASA